MSTTDPLRRRGSTVIEALRSGRALLTNAASLASATAITSVLGVVYWIVAARLYSSESIGLAGAAISAMTFVATLASLGLSTFVMGELPRSSSRRLLLRDALSAAALLGGLIGLGYAVVVPSFSETLGLFVADPLVTGLFALGASATAIGMVLDAGLIGLMRGTVQLNRNIVMGVSKLAALAGLGLLIVGSSWTLLFATWVGGTLFSLSTVAVSLKRRPLAAGGVVPTRLPQWVALRSMVRSVAGHQGLNLALRLPILLLPVFVVGWVSAEANSLFYIAWMITNFAFVLPGALATVLYAASAADAGALREKLRLSLSVSLAVTSVVTAVILAFPTLLLSVFGSSYEDGATTLRILAIAGVPLVAKNHYVNVMRAKKRTRQALPLVSLGAVAELLLAALGAHLGDLEGLCAGWLTAIWLEALLMVRTVIRAARDEDDPASASVGSDGS